MKFGELDEGDVLGTIEELVKEMRYMLNKFGENLSDGKFSKFIKTCNDAEELINSVEE